MIICFLFILTLLMWCITLTDLWILKNPCISGINPTWSWWMTLLMSCWIQFASILLRIFASIFISISSVQFLSRVQLFATPMDCRTPGLPVHHQLPELAQTHVHRVGDAIEPSHPLSSPSPPAFNLSQYQGLFQWVSSSHQVPKVLDFQLQHQSFQWIFRTDFL